MGKVNGQTTKMVKDQPTNYNDNPLSGSECALLDVGALAQRHVAASMQLVHQAVEGVLLDGIRDQRSTIKDQRPTFKAH